MREFSHLISRRWVLPVHSKKKKRTCQLTRFSSCTTDHLPCPSLKLVVFIALQRSCSVVKGKASQCVFYVHSKFSNCLYLSSFMYTLEFLFLINANIWILSIFDYILVQLLIASAPGVTDGAGGKGTWGKLLDTDSDFHLDRNDPNYDSAEVCLS